MPLKEILAKLTRYDKEMLLRHIIILPMIEEDCLTSNIMIAGLKMGFDQEEITTEIHKQANETGATIQRWK